MEKKHKRSGDEIANEFELAERKSKIAKNTEHDGEEKKDATTSKNRSGQCSADTKPNVGECSATLDRQQHKMNDETKSKIAFDQNPSPDIFKLHAIVCFELFEYLSLKDIHSMGQTCKRFNRIAGKYFHDNYSAVRIYFEDGEIHYNNIPISGFSHYVNKIWIDVRDVEQLKYVQANVKSLKEIILWGMRVEDIETKVECIRETLAKIETINLKHSEYNVSFNSILKYCSNIKSISIDAHYSIDASWLHQKYPTLEHLSFIGNGKAETKDDWKTFFKQNPNIRNFGCETDFLVENEDWLLMTNATFDYLFIQHRGGINKSRLCSVVKRLYERGFYKKLRISFLYQGKHLINEMCKFPAVERLTDSTFETIDWPVMADVKELRSYQSDINVESMINCKFPNVERIELLNGLKLDQLFILIRLLKKLEELRLRYYNNDEIKQLNLWALNKERAKLTGAGKVTIYVKEEIFLATKWANNNRDFKLIEMKPDESWPYDFELN